ncbi:hypothetical protein BC835DRAFT_1357698 [Cytidiella melzeri]|nr:hypothetical protein BC835DRAFT_1357698 [Cytidiella melzeri]
MANNAEYHTVFNYIGHAEVPGWIVPQQVYKTDTAFQANAPVQFYVGGQLGIRLSDALAQNVYGLADSNQPVILTTNAMKIGIRIWWPGYERWIKHIHVYGHSSDRPPITKALLAFHIARLVHEFRQVSQACYLLFKRIRAQHRHGQEMAHKQSTEERRDWWTTNIPFEQLVLLELRHVSLGSWQPVMCRAA